MTRLNSTSSNCSGDSGTQLSLASDYSSRDKLLPTLQEKESPEPDSVLSCPRSDIYCCNDPTCGVPPGSGNHLAAAAAAVNIYETISGSETAAARQGEGGPQPPPPVPPRFATIRKSYTLPHNMAGAGAGQGRIYDNPAHLRRDTAAPAAQGQGSLPKRAGQQLLRPRPSSLSVEKRQFLRSVSQDNSNPR